MGKKVNVISMRLMGLMDEYQTCFCIFFTSTKPHGDKAIT